MLYQHADEALDRAENRAMDHHRTFFGSRARGVRKLEALGQVIIELNRRDLPFPLERIGHINLDLGAVEGAFLRIYLELYLVAAERIAELGLGNAPLFFVAEVMLGHGREFETEL